MIQEKPMRILFVALLSFLAGLAVFSSPGRADVLLDVDKLVAAPGVAPPSEYPFTLATAQPLTVTLTDFQTPAAFTSLQLAVTLGDTLVGTSAVVDAATSTATVAVPGVAGDYVLHVIGVPAAAQGYGSFGVCVAPAASATQCIAADSFSGNIETPNTAATTATSTLNTNFTSTVAGNYTVTLTDDVFPVALQSLSAGIFQGGTAISVAIPSGTATQVNLAAGTSYQLLVAATADATLEAGLYGIEITDPNGATVFNRTLPVGTMPASNLVTTTSAQNLSLTLTDFGYPTALSHEGVAVTSGSTSLAQLTAAGSLSNFMAPSGVLEIWQYTVAGAQPGVYSVALANATESLYSTTQVVNPSASASSSATQQSFAFAVDLPAAGTYNLVANDFQFPAALQSINATVAQNGTALTVDSSGNFNATAGYVVVVVQATPTLGSGSIFGVTVQTGGTSPQLVFEQTQEVNGVFNTQTVNVTSTGDYDFALNDLLFPAKFADLAVVVSQGSQVLSKIYAEGGGSGPSKLNLTPGQYVLTFVTSPNASGMASTQNYGLYSFLAESSAPTITFSSSAPSVTTGQSVTLTWSTQDATACTASGNTGWSGSEPTSGTATVTISATATLTLTCTGAGGSTAQSLTVNAAASNVKLGGGGALGWESIAILAFYVLLTNVRRRIRT
jgi:hypothetical protein